MKGFLASNLGRRSWIGRRGCVRGVGGGGRSGARRRMAVRSPDFTETVIPDMNSSGNWSGSKGATP